MNKSARGSESFSAQIWVLGLTSLASFMVALDALVVSTALSTIRLHFGASVEELEWTVNGYGLSFAVLLMSGAALGDRYGCRRMFLAGITLFVAASALCALAPTMGSLIAARVLQGCGAALVMPLTVTQVSVAFSSEQRAGALGTFSGVTALAVLAGPAVGCTLEDCRLEDAERLKPYLTLMSVVAWRLFWLTHINRQNPDAPCTAILADHEWKALYTSIHRAKLLPDTIPSVRQAVRWIAQLGGFLGRKGDGEPGITMIWRGCSRLAGIAVLYLILHPSEVRATVR